MVETAGGGSGNFMVKGFGRKLLKLKFYASAHIIIISIPDLIGAPLLQIL